MHDNPFVFLCTICQRITEPLELNAVCDRIRRCKSIINFSLRQYSIKTSIDQKDINIFRRVLEVTQMLLIIKQRTCGRRFIIKLTGHEQQLILDRIPERLDRLIQRTGSAWAEATIRNSVVVIARADNLSQACDIPYASIDRFTLRDFT